MVVDNGIYFEFVPFNDLNFDEDGNIKPDAVTLSLSEVKINEDYALLLSTNAGAWRYLIGDTIRFVNVEKYQIIITGRTKHFLSICGEHLSGENINRAIEMLQEEFNLDIREFTVAGIRHGSMFAHHWFLGTNDTIDPQTALRKIDSYLNKLNDDYMVERTEAIKELFISIIPMNVFNDYMKKIGKEGSANKFPRVLKNRRLDEWQAFLKEMGYEKNVQHLGAE